MIALMASNLSPELEQLRAEIAAAAARMIAEDGSVVLNGTEVILPQNMISLK